MSLTINNARIIGENLNVLALKIITIIFNKSRRNGENMRDFEKISFDLREYIKETTENPMLDTEILEVGDGLAISKLKK